MDAELTSLLARIEDPELRAELERAITRRRTEGEAVGAEILALTAAAKAAFTAEREERGPYARHRVAARAIPAAVEYRATCRGCDRVTTSRCDSDDEAAHRAALVALLDAACGCRRPPRHIDPRAGLLVAPDAGRAAFDGILQSSLEVLARAAGLAGVVPVQLEDGTRVWRPVVRDEDPERP